MSFFSRHNASSDGLIEGSYAFIDGINLSIPSTLCLCASTQVFANELNTDII